MYTWGNGYNYRLGHGTEANVTYPKRISTIKQKVVDISVGTKHTVAVTENGQVKKRSVNILKRIYTYISSISDYCKCTHTLSSETVGIE